MFSGNIISDLWTGEDREGPDHGENVTRRQLSVSLSTLNSTLIPHLAYLCGTIKDDGCDIQSTRVDYQRSKSKVVNKDPIHLLPQHH